MRDKTWILAVLLALLLILDVLTALLMVWTNREVPNSLLSLAATLVAVLAGLSSTPSKPIQGDGQAAKGG